MGIPGAMFMGIAQYRSDRVDNTNAQLCRSRNTLGATANNGLKPGAVGAGHCPGLRVSLRLLPHLANLSDPLSASAPSGDDSPLGPANGISRGGPHRPRPGRSVNCSRSIRTGSAGSWGHCDVARASAGRLLESSRPVLAADYGRAAQARSAPSHADADRCKPRSNFIGSHWMMPAATRAAGIAQALNNLGTVHRDSERTRRHATAIAPD
jgi:hypothetical protein